MRISRVYTRQPLSARSIVDLDETAAHHLLDVLRLRRGAALRLFNGDGCEYAGEIIAVRRRNVRVEINDLARREPEPAIRFHLQLGISRGERMDYAIQKAVELGVSSLTPLFTERTQVRLETERAERRLAHWRKITIYASEQSDRCYLPRVHEPLRLEESLDTHNDSTAYVLHHQSGQTLEQMANPNDDVYLLIGPEGGLSPRERALAESRGYIPVRLGPRVLRTETAPVVALAAMQMLWGDFRSSPEGLSDRS